MVARCASIASIEHSDPVVDAVRAHRRGSPRARNRAFSPVDERAPAVRAPPRCLPARRRPRRLPRVGAAPERIALRAGGVEHALEPVGYGVYEAVIEAEPGDRLRVRRSTARRCPTRARAGSRTGCAARRGCSTRPRSSGATTTGSRPPSATLVIYELHVGTFTPEGTFEAAIPHLRGAARARRHRDRADAGRRVPRPPRLGLRRRLPDRRPVLLRRAARPAEARRRRPPRGPRGDARRRLQPRRRLRHAGAAGVRPVLHLALRDAVGRGDQLRRRRLRRRPRVGDPERRAVGARLPPRRPAARRHPRDHRRQPGAPRRRGRPPHRSRRS